MITATFDTHRFYQKFKNDGFTENQANDIIEFVSEAVSAKNADVVTSSEQAVFKSEMKADFAELRSDFAELRSELREDIHKLENGLRTEIKTEIRWFAVFTISIISIINTAVVALLLHVLK